MEERKSSCCVLMTVEKVNDCYLIGLYNNVKVLCTNLTTKVLCFAVRAKVFAVPPLLVQHHILGDKVLPPRA